MSLNRWSLKKHDEDMKWLRNENVLLDGIFCPEKKLGKMTSIILAKRKHISFFPSLKLTARTGKKKSHPQRKESSSFAIYRWNSPFVSGRKLTRKRTKWWFFQEEFTFQLWRFGWCPAVRTSGSRVFFSAFPSESPFWLDEEVFVRIFF